MKIYGPQVLEQALQPRPTHPAYASPCCELIEGALGRTSLGELLVVVGPQGVRAVSLGPEAKPLWAEAQRRLGHALQSTDTLGTTRVLRDAATLCEAPHARFSWPLDLRGTPFQQRVWRALRTIPLGTTLAYGELAGRLGTPLAVRAVASACAANAHAVVVPCHRVVRRNGALSGYRWGLPLKAELLQREARALAAQAGA